MLEYVKSQSALDTSDVADAVVYVLSTPPHVQVLLKSIGFFNHYGLIWIVLGSWTSFAADWADMNETLS